LEGRVFGVIEIEDEGERSNRGLRLVKERELLFAEEWRDG
jgi:hypothetical protein